MLKSNEDIFKHASPQFIFIYFIYFSDNCCRIYSTGIKEKNNKRTTGIQKQCIHQMRELEGVPKMMVKEELEKIPTKLF